MVHSKHIKMNDVFDDDEDGENGGRKTTKSLGIHFGEWTSLL